MAVIVQEMLIKTHVVNQGKNDSATLNNCLKQIKDLKMQIKDLKEKVNYLKSKYDR